MKKFFAILLITLILIFSFGFSTIPNENSQTELLIMMYHSVKQHKKDRYIVTPNQFEEDIKTYIELGYTPVLPKEIKYFVEGKKVLPKKTILISFDDGEYNFIHYAVPIIEKYCFKANMNVVGRFCNYTVESKDVKNPNYSYLTWAEIKYLSDLEHIEIGNHSYNMHNYKPRFGMLPNIGESDDNYKKAIREDVLKLQSILLKESNCSPITLAFPYGKFNEMAITELKKLGFSVFLTCNEGKNYLKVGDTNKLTHLKRINREGNFTNEMLRKVINKY